MSHARLRALLLSCCLGFTALAPHAETGEVEPLDGIAAVVEDQIITLSEYQERLEEARRRVAAQNLPLPEAEVRRQVLEQMALELLQLREAQRRGITVDDITLDNALRGIAADNGTTLDGLRRKVEAEGQDWAEFREAVRRDLLRQRLRRQVILSRVVLTEQEITDELLRLLSDKDVRYRLAHLKVLLPAAAERDAVAAAERRAEDFYRRAVAGEDFARLVAEASGGREALGGGDLGWRGLDELPAAFVPVVVRLPIGGVSRPFRAEDGIHILKLLDVRGIPRHTSRQVHVRHILLVPSALEDDEAVRLRLQSLREQIVSGGADFAELARAHSEDPGSAAAGGDLGWSDPAEFSPKFRALIEKLPVGRVSEPFRSEYGWHIAQVLGWREHDDSVERLIDQARQAVFARKAAEEERLWQQRLLDEAYIDYRVAF